MGQPFSELLKQEVDDADCFIEGDHYNVVLDAFFSGCGWRYIRTQLLRVSRGIDRQAFNKLAAAASKSPPQSEEELKTVFVKNLFFMQNKSSDSRYTRERACYMLISLEQWRLGWND